MRSASRRPTLELRRHDGFTLIEVLAALLIVSLVFGLLLESVTTNLSDIGRARLEARAMQLAEQRAREIAGQIESGTEVEEGTSEGAYEGLEEDLHWQVVVSGHTLDLPADYPGKEPPSPLFAVAGSAPPVRARGPGDPPPPLRLIEVRVYPAEVDPGDADPFVLLVASPPDAARLEQLQLERQQQVPQQPDAGTESQP